MTQIAIPFADSAIYQKHNTIMMSNAIARWEDGIEKGGDVGVTVKEGAALRGHWWRGGDAGADVDEGQDLWQKSAKRKELISLWRHVLSCPGGNL